MLPTRCARVKTGDVFDTVQKLHSIIPAVLLYRTVPNSILALRTLLHMSHNVPKILHPMKDVTYVVFTVKAVR